MKTMTKKLYLILGVSLLMTLVVGNVAQAQSSARAGIRGGFNVSNLYTDDLDDKNARYGFNVGVFGQPVSSETLALQLELNYTTKGNRFVSDGFIDQETKFNLGYLELPVLAVFKLGEAAEIHVGGYASYLLAASTKTDGDLGSDFEEFDRDNFNTFDYGVIGGVGFNLGAVQIGARYNLGLGKIAKSDAAEVALGDAKNSVGSVYVSFNFNQD